MAAPRNGTPQPPRPDGPHQGAAVVEFGLPLGEAHLAMILVHGRGATAENILGLTAHFGRNDIAYRAPQANGNTWYPYSFLAPLEENEPGLSSALGLIAELVGAIEKQGIPSERIVLAGFSQGACLSLEFTARNPRRYGAVLGLSGGLIGPPGTTWASTGSLASTPVFLGCGDLDTHIPTERVHETTKLLRRLGGDVTERIYPGMGHGINEDEMETVRQMLGAIE